MKYRSRKNTKKADALGRQPIQNSTLKIQNYFHDSALRGARTRVIFPVYGNTGIDYNPNSTKTHSADKINYFHDRALRGARTRVFHFVNTNTCINQNPQTANAYRAHKINYFHNFYFYLFFLVHHISKKEVPTSIIVALPPTENNNTGDMSCRITPVSNMPPISNFATSSKNFAASVFMTQKYNIYTNNTNFFNEQ